MAGSRTIAAASRAHELDAPPWRRVESTLMATARAIRQAYDRRFEELDLNLTQASLLALLHESGPHSQTAIGQRLGMGRAAAGSLVDGLERRRLVARTPDESDRRVWRVALTAEGRQQVAPVHEIDRELREELRAGISREERQQLAGLLLRLQTNLDGALSESEESA